MCTCVSMFLVLDKIISASVTTCPVASVWLSPRVCMCARAHMCEHVFYLGQNHYRQCDLVPSSFSRAQSTCVYVSERKYVIYERTLFTICHILIDDVIILTTVLSLFVHDFLFNQHLHRVVYKYILCLKKSK